MPLYMLFQISDSGNFFYNSGSDSAPLIAAGKELAKAYPGTDYIVKCGDVAVWSSREQEAAFSLFRTEGSISLLILPGSDADALTATGRELANQHPDWTLEVKDTNMRVIWTNGKNAPGTAEGTEQNDQ